MLGLLAPTLLALVAALACGGSLRSLSSSRIRAWPAVLAAFATELLIFNPPLDGQPWAMSIGPWVWLVARLVLLSALIANSGQAWPLRVAALGLGLNTLVIVLNGGHMPQAPEAALAAWGASHIDPGRLENVVAFDAHTRLAWLGDVLVEPDWLPRRNIVSIGDLLLSAGIAWWAFSSARPSFASLRRRIVSRVAPSIYGEARSQRRHPN
jgi:uncharacterized protein DUF5317